jgi:hypothetical protein
MSILSLNSGRSCWGRWRGRALYLQLRHKGGLAAACRSRGRKRREQASRVKKFNCG